MMYVGTSGFTLQNFYPDTIKSADKLSFYRTIFNTVEINSTFYHMPLLKTVERWLQTAEDLVFAFKVFQGITHEAYGKIDTELINKWFERFSLFETETRKHSMLFQFPAQFSLNEKYFIDLLNLLPDKYSYAFEFRHQSWFIESIYRLVEEKYGTIVFSDSPVKANKQPTWPMVTLENENFSYMRFHGVPKLYRSSYTDDQLQEFANLITKKLQQNKNVYAYFNNDASGHAAENAKRLIELVSFT